MVDRPLHEASPGNHRRLGGGTSLVDRVTLVFAPHHGIRRTFAFDTDLGAAGLVPAS